MSVASKSFSSPRRRPSTTSTSLQTETHQFFPQVSTSIRTIINNSRKSLTRPLPAPFDIFMQLVWQIIPCFWRLQAAQRIGPAKQRSIQSLHLCLTEYASDPSPFLEPVVFFGVWRPLLINFKTTTTNFLSSVIAKMSGNPIINYQH